MSFLSKVASDANLTLSEKRWVIYTQAQLKFIKTRSARAERRASHSITQEGINDWVNDKPQHEPERRPNLMKTLTPAYSRDYTSAKAATAAYLSGADFILNDATSPWNGKPCSCRDFPNEQVILRYSRLRKVTTCAATQSDSRREEKKRQDLADSLDLSGI